MLTAFVIVAAAVLEILNGDKRQGKVVGVKFKKET